MALADSYNLEKFDPEVLREYDIRGIVDKNLLDDYKICVKNNINARIANIDAGNDFLNVSTNLLYKNVSESKASAAFTECSYIIVK